MSEDARDARAVVVAAAVLALAALGVSVYLSVQSLTGGAVAGCGNTDAGCGLVLSSKWASVGPIPVSLLGAATYFVVLFGLGLRGTTKQGGKAGNVLLLMCAPALLIAAGWFTVLQLSVIGELCPYCMVGHGLGLVIGVLLLKLAYVRSSLESLRPLLIGLSLVSTMIAIQTSPLNHKEPASAYNHFADQEGDEWVDGRRVVSIFGGEMAFYLDELPQRFDERPYLGDAQADQVVALVFDYGCVHCREMHAMLEDALAQDPARFVLVPLPVSIHESVNSAVASISERFSDSFVRAELSYAVAAIDREAWVTFDRWLFAPDDREAFPRYAEDARAKAVELVGQAALDEQLANEALRDRLMHNIGLLNLLPEDQREIPVTTTPGAPRHLTERVDAVQTLMDYLDEAGAGSD